LDNKFILEFDVDLSGLAEAAKAMQALGQLTEKQTAEIIGLAGKQAEAQRKVTQEVREQTSALGALNKNLANTTETIAGGAVKQGADAFGKVTTNVGEAASTTQRLTKRLGQLRDQIAKLPEGSAEFERLSIEAGKIEDRIGDVSKRVRILASDTKNLDALVSAASGIAGAFSVAQGAAALFGNENKDLQQALLKVQGSIAVLNGLQAVAATINKDSAASVVLLSNAKKAYSIVVGSTTGALKTFRVALASTGIGAIVIAVGALAANFDAIKQKLVELFPSLGNLGGVFDTVRKKALGFLSQTIEGLKIAVEILYNFFTGDFGDIAAVAAQAGERLAKARNEGELAEEKRQQEKREAAIIEGLIKENNRKLKVMEAQGKDTYNLRKKILEDELKLLKQRGEADAIQDKQTEIEVLTIEHNKKMEEINRKNAERQEALALQPLEALEKKSAQLINNPIEIKIKVSDPREQKMGDLERTLQDEAEKKKKAADELNAEIKDASISFASELSDTISGINAERIQSDLDTQVAALEAEKEAVLSNKRLTNNQREVIENQYRKKEAKLKEEAFKKEKEAKIIETIIATALAIVKASPNPIQMALAATTGALSLTTIKTQPVPAFRKGTKSAPGGWALVGEEGAELVHLPPGAQVISNPDTQRFLSGSFADVMRKYNIQVNKIFDFDYVRLGREVAANAGRISINIDEGGFHTRIARAYEERIYLDRKLSLF
jgi:hypothetical protein